MNNVVTRIQDMVHGTTPVSVDTVTQVRMVKKHRETKEPNPYIGAVKIQTKNGLIGFDYHNSVNNQAKREGKDERGTAERKWGELGPKRVFVFHKDNVYLQIKLQSTGDTKYMFKGKVIDLDDIKPYLSSSGKSGSQRDLEKEVIVNDINIDNIRKIRLYNEEIEV